MNDFFNKVFLDNTIKSYLLVFAVMLFVVLLKRYISRYIAGLLFRIINRIWKNVDKSSFRALVVKPLGWFLVIFISLIMLHRLKFPEVLETEIYSSSTSRVVHGIANIIMISSFIWLLLRMIDFIATILERKANITPGHADNQLIVFFRDFFKVVIIINGILLILHYAFDFDIKSLTTGLSIVGAAIALSLRESLENLIASFIIFFDKPFSTGDLVRVQNVTGTIEKIGLRSTRIRTDQKTFVTVPNKQMVDTIVDNLSLRTQRKGELRLEISLTTSSQSVDDLVERIKKILSRNEIEAKTVLLSDITGQSFVIQADYFTAAITLAEFNTVKQEVNMQILKTMEELNIQVSGAGTDVRITGMPRM
jgi:MscS family membrane protein